MWVFGQKNKQTNKANKPKTANPKAPSLEDVQTCFNPITNTSSATKQTHVTVKQCFKEFAA